MSLTGPLFLNAIIVVTIAAFVVVIMIWPRFSRRTPWGVAGRVVALLLVNVLVLLAAATQLNATYLFFASWADLHGAITGHLVQTSLQRGGAAQQAPNLATQGQAAPVLRHTPALVQPVSSAGLITATVHGRLSGVTGTILVQLPPGYTSAAAATQRYPVLEAFGGYPSSPVGLLTTFHLQQSVQQQVQARRLRPPLIVMPQIEIPRGVDTEGVNGAPGQPQVETWLTRDVPAWVGQHFRVVAHRNAWATVGYSVGGFIAAMGAILHPAQYGAAIVLGGYFRPDFGPLYEPFTPTSPLGRHYDLARTVAHHPPPVSLWVETSHADPLSYATSAHLLRVTRPPMAVHAVVLRNAGHRISVWTALMPQALRWLGHNVQGFRP